MPLKYDCGKIYKMLAKPANSTKLITFIVWVFFWLSPVPRRGPTRHFNGLKRFNNRYAGPEVAVALKTLHSIRDAINFLNLTKLNPNGGWVGVRAEESPKSVFAPRGVNSRRFRCKRPPRTFFRRDIYERHD